MNPAGSLRSRLARVRSFVRAMARRGRLESDMEAELADHIERVAADLVAAGCPPAEARRRARIAMGTVLTHKEAMRASLGLRWGDEVAADIRYGARLLGRDLWFTGIAVISLALAIGANTTLFSVTKQVLFDRLTVPRPDELRLLRWSGDAHSVVHSMWGSFNEGSGGRTVSTVFSYPAYTQMRAQNHVMRDLFAYKDDSMNATLHGTAKRAEVHMVSGNYFSELEVPAAIGRVLTPADDESGAMVVMLSDGVWRRDFDASPAVLGQTVRVNQMTLTVVGVAPRGFTGVKNVLGSPDLYVPLRLQPQIDPKVQGSGLTNVDHWWVNVMARRRPGIDDRTAQAALAVALESAVRATMTVKAGETLPRLQLDPGHRGLHWADDMFKKPMTVLLGLTGLVLLLACANIANLQLARGAKRQREMSLRLAVGAGRGRILRQLLTESLVLALLGGLGGLVLGYAGRNIIPTLLSNAWDNSNFNMSFDWRVFAFTAAVTLMTGILFGLAPAWAGARTGVSTALQQTASTHSRRRGRGAKSIVAFQVALSTLLVVGAGLFLRTLLALGSLDAGFDTDHLLLFEIDPPANRYPAGADVQLHARLEQRIAALPGVQSVATGWIPYFGGSVSNGDFFVEGEPSGGEHRQAEDMNVVGNAFFATMGIPIVGGRAFGAQDTATSAKAGIINQALARTRFPNVNPIGKRFRTGDPGEWIQIVGICADTRLVHLRAAPPPQFFVPLVQQKEVGGMIYQVRTQMKPAELVPGLRRVVQAVDPDLPLVDVRTQREQIDADMQMERMFAALTSGFGVLALALACVGIYGVMAYSVAQRTNEIGIRMALGASSGQVRGMVLREGSWMAAGGVAGGLSAALLLARLVQSMLYGIRVFDPPTVASAVLLLLVVATAAMWVPARRAARVEPMQALRCE